MIAEHRGVEWDCVLANTLWVGPLMAEPIGAHVVFGELAEWAWWKLEDSLNKSLQSERSRANH